jgi:hypothetical protein
MIFGMIGGRSEGRSIETRTMKALFLLLLVFIFSSCAPGEKAATGIEAPAGQTPGPLLRSAVLIRGNYWVNGVLGFGENSFSALIGEYRLRDISGDGGVFSLYLTGAPLYFSEEWAASFAGNLQARSRSGEDGFFAALDLDDGLGTIWTAVFHFPLGVEASGLSADDLRVLLRAWADEFLYFLSLTRKATDLSLPAAVEF